MKRIKSNELEKLTDKLRDILLNTSNEFIYKLLEESGEFDTSDLLNIILQSHINSAFLQMIDISGKSSSNTEDEYYKLKNNVISFIKKLIIFIQENAPK